MFTPKPYLSGMTPAEQNAVWEYNKRGGEADSALRNNIGNQLRDAGLSNIEDSDIDKVLNGMSVSQAVSEKLAQANPNNKLPTETTEQWLARIGRTAQPASTAQSAIPSVNTITPTTNIAYPTISLGKGSTGAEVRKLQDYLVSRGYMTQEQVNTGYGTYGPKTTAAVLQLQKDLGIDYSSGPGYFGSKTIATLQQIAPIVSAGEGTAAAHGTTAIGETTDATTAGTQPSTGMIDTGDETLNRYLSAVIELLTKAEAQGKKINPNVDLATLAKSALEEASAIVEPYYSSQMKSVRGDLEKSLTSLAKSYEAKREDQAQKYRQTLGIQQETEAGKGTIFSGGRIQRERELGTSAGRSFEELARQTQEAGQQYGAEQERTLGSLGIGAYQAPTIGQYGISPISQLTPVTSRQLFTPEGGITGSMERQRDIEREKLRRELFTKKQEEYNL